MNKPFNTGGALFQAAVSVGESLAVHKDYPAMGGRLRLPVRLSPQSGWHQEAPGMGALKRPSGMQ
jgi:2-oxo-4-hydroxy-4-carboxy--5-ureidoimidazoline (OHCU) decarboxylase